MQGEDTVSERRRRWARNPLGSARRGSNPHGFDWFGAEPASKVTGLLNWEQLSRLHMLSLVGAVKIGSYVQTYDIWWFPESPSHHPF